MNDDRDETVVAQDPAVTENGVAEPPFSESLRALAESRRDG